MYILLIFEHIIRSALNAQREAVAKQFFWRKKKILECAAKMLSGGI